MKKIFTAFMMMLCAACVASAANYLTFTAEEDGSTFGIVNNKNTPDVQYSLDDGATWTDLVGGTEVTLVSKGDKALLMGNNPEGFSKSRDQYSTFRMTGKVSASGSVMSLIDGTGLSTEIPNGYCFCRLFRNCTSLTQAPELPATSLTIYCYDAMFLGCTNLKQVPTLPATTLADFCYDGMFARCTSLTQAPELPVTTLASGCYYSMFSDCTGLTQAPALPATTLADSCYMYMFSGCTGLSEIHVSFDDWRNAGYSTAYWVENVAPSGTFICPENLPLEYGANRIPLGWRVKKVIDGDTVDVLPVNRGLLTFTAEEDGSTFGIVNNGKNNPDVQYSLDGGDIWIALAAGDTITLAHKGDKALLRGNNPEGFSRSRTQYSTFEMTGKVSASGSVMSLIDGVGKTLVVPASFCFHSLFEGCTSLTQAPELPATTLTENCYRAIFSGCTSLTQAPALPATTLAYSCYWEMFEGCTSLTQAPKLPATTLAEACYFGMFSSCTSLTQAPELPATTLAYSCYKKMFSSCDLLRQAPELPATTLVSACYQYMFSGCTSLTQAPELPAPELIAHSNVEISCYFGMFSECTNLSEISVAFVKWKDSTDRWEDNTYRWVENVAPTGTFICPKALPLEYGVDRIPEGWTVKYIEDMANYLTFTAEEDGSTFGIVNNGGNNPDIQYSLDGGETWTALAAGDTVTLAHKGDKALLRGDNPEGFSKSRDQYSTFRMTGKVAASGSVMSLIDGMDLSTEIPGEYCFYSLFAGCRGLTRAPELPATTLAYGCYSCMFRSCTSLTQAPELPATTLATDCYLFMFYGCTSLTQAPALPATTLEVGCYVSMFEGCTSLTQAPELPALELNEGGYTYMFSGCTSLRQAPELPATKLTGSCYYYMFSGCTSLTHAPELPATELVFACYESMFEGCTSLTQAPELPATTLADYCYKGMFSGCTSLTQAPALPATTLAEDCYSHMFIECTNLSRIHVSFDSWLDVDLCTFEWVKDVAPTGTFICPKTLPLEYGISRIPEGWTVKYIDDTVAVDDTVVVEANYLTFTAEEDSSTFGIVNGRNSPNVLYSLDGGKTWTALAGGDTVVLAHKGDKALLKGNNPHGFSQNYMEYQSSFKMTGKIAASGSVMSLIDGTGLSSEIRGVVCFGSLFENCTSLTQAPELPATTLTEDCYAYMFRGCTSLTQAPELPATTLADGCYWEMFSGCTSLTQAPELPATTLTEDCYAYMFRGCTSLTQAPALIATKLAGGCYCEMFSGCTSLTQAPALPATTLADACYSYMFSSCTSLTEAPALPATTLANNCYYSMFSGCTSLTKAPNLPAPELPAPVNKNFCYGSMFLNCTNLSEISVAFNVWDDNTSWWVKDVAPTGTFYCPKALPLEYGVSRIPEGWTVKYIDDTVAVEANYLTFTAEEDGSTFGIVNEGENNPNVQYSLNGGETWNALAAGDTITLAHKGDKALLRGYNPEGFSKGYNKYSSFTMTGKIAASGSVMSLIDGVGLSTEIPNGYCFCRLFRNCTSLTQAPELPATTLANNCYYSMFSGCTSLTQAPELPAMTLADDCYFGMFLGCTSLTRAPELPATKLARGCYESMFSGCTSLTEAPKLPATTLAEECYNSMFRGCTSLTEAPELPAMTLEGLCYDRMFSDCTSLTQAPELPATTLADFCYGDMFYGCTSLTQAPELPATTLAYGCYSCMFRGCTSLTEAPELPAMTLEGLCYDRMFSDCTSLTQAPELPAPELIAHSNAKMACYWEMFSGCTNLSEIRVAFVEWRDSTDQNDNTSGWVKNVAPAGTFYCPKALSLEYGVDRIPEGWTVKYIEDMANYLTFTAEEDGSTFGIVNKDNNPDVQYSLDGGKTWTALAAGDTITLVHKGDKALLKGNNPQGFSFSRWNKYSSFTMTGKVAASGSVMSLIDGLGLSTAIPGGFCFNCLFEDCTSLTQAPELPATTLAEECYYSMFSRCTGLAQAPELPATTLAKDCYLLMFSDCTSLTQAPELPATTLAEACYYSMFSRCTSLAQAPELPATTLADYCYYSMFSGCTSLAQAPTLSSMVMVEGCYSHMFSGCTSLTQAPELPATTLPTVIESGCYQGMFSRCTSLTQAPELPATTLANFCYREMFSGCANLTQAPELPATTLAEHCYDDMFSGCTSLTQAPALPATTLAEYCYLEMFKGCTSLSQIDVFFDDWNYNSATSSWVKNVAPTGTFICPKALALEYGEDRIPEGWTVQYIGEEGSGVSSALADGITVWIDDLTIFVRGAEGEVSLYDLSGKRVAVSVSADEERALSVPSEGVYMVRTNNGTSVVLVR